MPFPKRSPAFWVLLVVAGAAACCGLPLAALAAVGLTAEDAPASGPGEAAAAVVVEEEEEGRPAAVEGSDAVDDFVYQSPNGMTYVAPSTVAAEGVAVPLVGEWRDDHRHLTLRLKDGGRYELTHGGGVLVGEKVSNAVAVGARDAERGSWSLDGTTLVLRPEGRQQSGSNGRTRLDAEEAGPDAARAWTVVGVTVEYTPQGQGVARQRPGLRVRGPSPEWYYPAGEWDLVLRSAPWSG